MAILAEDLKEEMRNKTDEELYLLLRVHSRDYTSEALKVASEEFGRRKLDETTISHIVAAAEKALEGETETMGEAKQRPRSDANEAVKGWSWRDSDLNETAKGLGWLILLCFVGYAIYGGYEWLDSIGWILHREDTSITARSDWLVGESKECWSSTLNSAGAALLGKDVGYAMPAVSCDDGPEHKIKVTFYGRKVQAEYKVVGWHCNRDLLSFTCYQIGGRQ